MKEKTVAIYCRVDDGAHPDLRHSALDGQRQKLERCAKRNKLTATRYYEDDGYSAHNMERPGLTQMIKDCESGLFSAILITGYDRLFHGIVGAQKQWPFRVYTMDSFSWGQEQ